MISGKRMFACLWVLFVFFNSTYLYAQVKNEDELKKQALQFFEEQEYAQAYKHYSQLVSLYPKDPEYNFKLGVCMLYSEPDKKKPFTYFQVALKNPSEAPKETKFYLAKTYHVNYRFDEAIKLYTEFKQTAGSSLVKKLEVDREIQACKNGKRLLSNLSDLVIINKKQLNEIDYFKAYDIKDIGGKLLVKPDDYKSSYDKKKKDKSVVYLPRAGNRLYYSSYGDGGSSGRDIYYVNRLPNGSWSKATKLPTSINTEFDEDYPFLHPNGKTLYFSSKGHNSMGGYDVFKTTYNEATQSWSQPENLEFPINSPDDDILFVTDSLEKTAFFSTGRYSPYGKLDVLKINTERRPMNFAIIKGTVVKEEASQSLKSKITVTDMSNGEIVGTYQAADNGDYFMELPNGGKFIFKVETPGIPTQSDGVQIPVAYTLKPYRQMISYDKKRLKITNYFDGDIPDENYSVMMDLIEKKAKLEVNENEPYNQNLLNQSKNQVNNQNTDKNNLSAVNSNNPTVQGGANETNSNKSSTTPTNKNVTNEELLNIAKEDAKEAEQESTELRQDAQNAYSLVSQKTIEANEKQKEAEQIIQQANAITDIAKKNEELAKANQLKEEARQASNIANIATNLAKRLEVDANAKQKEAELTNQYVNQLQEVINNKNNKEALTKLEQIQNELDAVSKQQNQSNELLASLKAEVDLKQQEITSTEKKINNISQEISTLKTEVETLEKDRINETDKTLKENIAAQIREVNNEIDAKNNELTNQNKRIEALRSDIDGIKQSIQIASNMQDNATDAVAVNASEKNNQSGSNINTTDNTNNQNTNSVTTIDNASPQNTTSLSYDGIVTKYADKVNTNKIEQSSKEELTQQNEILKNYNKDINDLIALDKNELSKTKNSTEKKKLSDEIKQLEKLKTDNNKLIANNDASLKKLTTSNIASNNTKQQQNNNASNIENNNQNSESTQQIGNDNNNQEVTNNNVAVTATNSDTNSAINNTAINNDNSDNQTALKPITTNNSNDNQAVLNQLNNLRTGLQSNSSTASQLFTFNDYKEQSSVSLKQTATQKFESAKQLENNFNNVLNKAEQDIKNSQQQNSDALLAEADALNNKAFEQRKESATKTGAEKDALIKQALENEKQAIDKKLEAATVVKNKNQSSFDLNAENLAALQKLTAGKESNEISQANMLVDEAALNFKQAKNLRTEAEAYPNGAARLGGLSNAEEKENQALAKQQKAMELLMKANPSFKPKENANSPTTNDIVSKVNSELIKVAQQQAESFLALSKANQNEFNAQTNKLLKNQNLTKPENKNAQDLKTNAEQLNNEAKALITQASNTSDASTKANLLLKANQKEVEAIKLMNQATTSLENNNLVNATTPQNNETNAIANNIQANENTNSTSRVTSTNSPSVTTTPTTSLNNNTQAVNNSTSIVSNTTQSTSATNTTSPSNTQTPTLSTVDNTSTNDLDKLKASLNNSNEAALTAFALYTSNESVEKKNKGVNQINTALAKDKQLEGAIDQLKQMGGTSPLTQNTISNLLSDAEKLNDEAAVLRRNSATKSTTERDKDIAQAKELEKNALSKKVEAANKQKQLNKAVFEANKQSLNDLEKLAQGKDIAELSSVSMMLTEADLFNKQAQKLREESDAYPSDAAKLGGYSNAEEKEQQAIAKQQSALALYKKHFPSYIPKQATVSTESPEMLAKLNETKEQIQTNNQTHIDGLLQLVEANKLEYNQRLNLLPANITANQNNLKTKAQSAYNKSLELANQANQTTDVTSRKSLLVQAVQSGQEAINLLNQINVNSNSVVNNNTERATDTNRNVANENNTNTVVTNTNANTSATNTNATNRNENNATTSSAPTKVIKVEGLEVKKTDAYSDSKPIPIDEKMPDGLVFKVQVGAFKTRLPNNTFKGLDPVVAQTTPNGYIRYMAGNFEQYASANAVKNDLRNLGYSDAFVVAYLNGKRITLSEATAQAQAQGQVIEMATNTSAGITPDANIPRNTVSNTTTNLTTSTPTDVQPVEVNGQLEQINGLLYTVQIGVYSKQVTRAQLFNLKPIYTEKLPNGLYRYTAGIYNQTNKLIEDKRKVVDLGVKDAFVSAYYNAKRVPYAEAQKLQSENNNLKLEPENPIIFPGENPVTLTQPISNITTSNTTTVSSNPSTQAFSNGVTEGPKPTADNGVKADESGISFKVQIGAYKNQVPNEVAAKFLNIKTWPVKNTVINGLYIYTIGNFINASYAKTLKEEAVSLGITDAFITVFKDGKKLYGAEASQYLTR